MYSRIQKIAVILSIVQFLSQCTFAQSLWQKQNSGINTDLYAISMLSDQIAWACGDKGKILYTSDGGANWKQQSSPVTSKLHDIQAISSLSAIAVGEDGVVLATIDGGLHWNARPSPTRDDLYTVTINGDQIYIGGVCGQIFYSRNNGYSWTLQSTNSTKLIYDLAVNQNQERAAATSGGEYLKSSTNSWTPSSILVQPYSNLLKIRYDQNRWSAINHKGDFIILSANPVIQSIAAFKSRSFSNVGATYFVCGDNGTIYTSSNSGSTWTKYNASVITANLYDIASTKTDQAWAVGSAGAIYALNPPKVNPPVDSCWKRISGVPTDIILNDLYFFDAKNGFIVGNKNYVGQISNGNFAQTILSGTSGKNFSLTGIHFQQGGNLGIIVGSSGSIWKTTDKGVNWTKLNTSPTMVNLTDVFIEANGNIRICGECGYYAYSTASGLSWTTNTNLSGTMVKIIFDQQKYFLLSGLGKLYDITNAQPTSVRQSTFLPYTVVATNQSILIAGRTDSLLRFKNNQWNYIKPVLFPYIRSSFSDGNGIILGCENGRVYRSSDHASSWSDISIQSNANMVVRGLYSLPNDIIYAIGEKGDFYKYECPLKVIDVTVSNIKKSDVKCYGECNGSYIISVQNGSGNLEFNWFLVSTTEVKSKDQNPSNLCAAKYGLEIIDKGFNNKMYIITNIPEITQPDSISLPNSHINITPESNQSNGKIEVAEPLGGTKPFTYKWSKNYFILSDTTPSIDSLSEGTYKLTITDFNQCSKVITFKLPKSTALNVTSKVTPVKCYGESNGSVELTPSGGNGSYTFKPSGGPLYSDLKAGIYTYTITDGNNNSKEISETVTQPDSISISTQIIHEQNTSDGKIEVTKVTGGIPPYRFKWKDGDTNMIRMNLSAGEYVLTITDSNSCNKIVKFEIKNNAKLSVKDSVIHVRCNGESNGEIFLNPFGKAPFTYIPSGGPHYKNYKAGNYTFQVTDANNNSTTLKIEVNQPDAISISSVQITHEHNGSDGKIEISEAMGGTPPYSYSWSNGSKVKDLINVVGGTYSLTVTDYNKCTMTWSFIIISMKGSVLICDPPTVQNSKCSDPCNGSISLNIKGGELPYTYSAKNGNTKLNDDGPFYQNLCSGSYSFTVTDNIGAACTVQSTIINESNQVLTIEKIKCAESNIISNGQYKVNSSGGLSPYTYQWCNNESTATATQLPSGPCSVTVTDNNGCSKTISFEVCVSVASDEIPDLITPNGDGRNDQFILPASISSLGAIQLTIANRWGDVVYRSDDYKNDWDGREQKSGEDLPPTSYYYVLSQSGKIIQKGIISILR